MLSFAKLLWSLVILRASHLLLLFASVCSSFTYLLYGVYLCYILTVCAPCVFTLLDLRKHDVAFLLTVRPTSPIGTRYNPNEPFVPQVGLVYVRGCEIEGMLDDAGKVIEEGTLDVSLSHTHTHC